MRPVIYAEISLIQLQRYGTTILEMSEFFREEGYRLFKNVGERHAKHDKYEPAELTDLESGGMFFDVLAVHRDDHRVSRLSPFSPAL
jgi:hypothetical protein